MVLGFALFSFFAFSFYSVISNICPFKISDIAEEVPKAKLSAAPAEMEQVLPKHPNAWGMVVALPFHKELQKVQQDQAIGQERRRSNFHQGNCGGAWEPYCVCGG